MLKDARGMLTFPLSRVKIFIEDSTAVWKMRMSAKIAKEAKKEKKEEKKKTVEANINLNDLSRVNDENWQALVDNHIIKDIPGWKTLVRSQRRECKLLFSDFHNIPYITCVKVINDILKKKTSYVMCVDDLADAYWCLKTVVKKEDIDCVLNV